MLLYSVVTAYLMRNAKLSYNYSIYSVNCGLEVGNTKKKNSKKKFL